MFWGSVQPARSVIIQMFTYYDLQHRLVSQAALRALFPEPLNQVLLEQN